MIKLGLSIMSVTPCRLTISASIVITLFLGLGCGNKSEQPKLAVAAPPVPLETNTPVPLAASAPVYVPDTTHANDPLPDGIIAWSSLLESADATNGQVGRLLSAGATAYLAKPLDVTELLAVVDRAVGPASS